MVARFSLWRKTARLVLAFTLALFGGHRTAVGQGNDQLADQPLNESVDSKFQELERLQQTPVPRTLATEAEWQTFYQTLRKRLQLAADLSAASSDVITRNAAVKDQFESHRRLVQYNSEDALDQLWDFAQRYVHDADPELSSLGMRYSLIVRLQRLLDGDRQQADQLDTETKSWLMNQPVTESNIKLAVQVASGLEKAEKYQLALTLLDAIVARAETASTFSLPDSVLSGVTEAQRRMSLVGKPFAISGNTIDHRRLAAEDVLGKVVLLDFWASWCGPCRKEMPLIREALDRYGQQGFVVIGVCLDEQMESATAYLDNAQVVSWPILMEQEPSLRGFEHPLVKLAGVSKLPTALLLDRQNRVISIAARGENLARWLMALFADKRARRSPIQPKGLMMTRGISPPIKLDH